MSSSQKSHLSPVSFQLLQNSAKFYGNIKILQQRKNSAARLEILWPAKKLRALIISHSFTQSNLKKLTLEKIISIN